MGIQPMENISSEEINDLRAFFYPDSIAVIGAGQNPFKPNGIPLYLLSIFGYGGDVYPVNPKYDRVAGLKCYSSILDIDAAVDLAVVAVAAEKAMDILIECAEKKVKAAIVFTSGFAEIGEEGLLKQLEMKKLADYSGMRILGPNCLGVLNYYNGSMASFFYNEERKDLFYPKMLSFISQSGGLGGIIYQMIVQMSIGFNYFVSTGNEADVSYAEVLNYLVENENVSIIAGYLEGLQSDGSLFIEACKKALEKQKMITMLKVGRTASGAAAAASHTGALAGADSVYDGVFRQYGVQRADNVEQMNALIALYATGRIPAGKRMAVITISGGGGVVVADKCPEYNIEVVRLTDNTQNSLREFFPPYGAVHNPVDLTSKLVNESGLFQQALRLVMQDPRVDVGGFFYNLEVPDSEAVRKIIEVYNETEKPLIIFTWPTGQDYAIKEKNKLVQAGVPVIEHIPSGLWAISKLVDWQHKVSRQHIYPVYNPGLEQKKSLEVINRLKSENGGIITEWRSKIILSEYGIPVTREALAVNAADAKVKAAEIGYPVALKIMSPHLPHKSDSGGVILNITDSTAAENAYHRIIEKAHHHKPEALIEGILVQEMLKPGLEIMIGIKKDPIFGPIVAVGVGGIFVEVFKDIAMRAVPLREEDAKAMIDELKSKALFEGVRGQLPRDIDALVAILMKVSRLAVELKDNILEMDINPLILYEKGAGAVAADALIVLN